MTVRLVAATLSLIVAGWLAAASAVAQDESGGSASPPVRGLVLPDKRVVLNAPVDGRVARIAVEEGQAVARGDLLVQFEDAIQQAVREAAAIRANAQAQRRRAELELEETEIMLARVTEAFERDAAGEWEVRRARVRRDLAKIAVLNVAESARVAQAELQLENERLARHRLTAPWDGVVVRLTAEDGSTLTRSDPVVQLVNFDELIIEIHLPVSMYAGMEMGRAYRFQADPPVDAELTGRLRFVDRLIDPGSQTFRCVFAVDNRQTQLPAGFAATLIGPANDPE